MFKRYRERRNLVAHAREARNNQKGFQTAVAIILAYNVIGVLDIASTVAAIRAGGVEANPVIRSMMESQLVSWIPTKLALQILVSGMVLWFPHRFVVGIFSVAVLINGGFVANNIRLAFTL